MSMTRPITIVQGGQYGSEAKGAIAAYLTKRDNVDIAVRTGATNAGHTAYYHNPATRVTHRVVLQQLPVGFVRPNTMLVLGAGSLIDPVILAKEVALLSSVTGTDIRSRLKIDRRAGLHFSEHADRSSSSGRHHAIGATGKGCSEALIDRIRNRGSSHPTLFGDTQFAHEYDICDTEAYLNYSWDEGAKILLEGTQGQLLDLYLGPYPYTTHKQTGPAQWMLEAGLSPSLPTEIVLVVRTFPIRVAGNSGPLPRETSWPHLARSINRLRHLHGLPSLVSEDALEEFEVAVMSAAATLPLPPTSGGLDQHEWSPADRSTYRFAVSEVHKMALAALPDSTISELKKLFEMTTVTKKLRRVAYLDRESLEASVRQARPAWIALTFMNYLFPQHWYEAPREVSPDEREFLHCVTDWTHTKIGVVSYGPEDHHLIDLR